MSRNFTRNHLRISVLPTQLSKFLEPERKSGQLFTSWDSALFNESNYLSGVRKIFAGKKLASRNSAFLCVFEHPTEYPSTFVRECLVFISHCVSRLETLDEKMRRKNPLNFVNFPAHDVLLKNSCLICYSSRTKLLRSMWFFLEKRRIS